MTHTFRINVQTPEKKDFQETLDVHSIFSTIQGEGPYCGHPAVFVRLAGCNLQCPGCDTEYTEGRVRMEYLDILRTIEAKKRQTNSHTMLIVISGGEPFRQDLNKFLEILYEAGYKVQIETNGTMAVPSILLNSMRQLPDGSRVANSVNHNTTIVCSPKASKIHPSIAQRADCFKYVMRAGNMRDEDGLPLQALEHRATPFIARPPLGFKGKIYLQPMDEQDDEINRRNTQAVLASAMNNNYIVQLQIHKLLDVE